MNSFFGQRSLLAVLMIALAGAVFAQDTAAPTAQADPSAKSADSDSKDRKNDKKKDKKSKDKKSEDAFDTTVFSDRVANNVLNEIRDGLEGHSQRLLLSAFDGDKMDAFLSFEDQIQAFFERYEGFRVHFRIIQTELEGPKGIVLADFEMEGMPRGGGPVLRRSSQLRFELERGKKGWKVIGLRPRGFFA